jgi:uncharacterized protein (TIGR03435 family)
MCVRLFPIALLCVVAQGQSQGPTFEAASIRPATPLGPLGMRTNRKGGPGTGDPGNYTCENCPVYWILAEAYGLEPYEYAGPDWLQNLRFDFAAKVPPGTTKEAFRGMLQNLLADRFKLAVHREKKEMQGYELTVARNGPKFSQSTPKDPPQEDAPPQKLQKDSEGFPIVPRGTTMAVVPGHARLRSDDQTMAWLAGMLAGQLQSPVTDATGLTAKYDYVLSWAFEENNAPAASAGGAPLVAGAQDAYHLALFGALQSQLGLKLAPKKGQVDVLLIDHMEKVPTGN